MDPFERLYNNIQKLRVRQIIYWKIQIAYLDAGYHFCLNMIKENPNYISLMKRFKIWYYTKPMAEDYNYNFDALSNEGWLFLLHLYTGKESV